jgi:strictosidine synthase
MTRPSIFPRTWRPPPDPGLVGPYAPNDALAKVERWEVGGVGPEDVVVDGDGGVFTGLADGRILRLGSGTRHVVADTGGRPLGLEFDREGRLVVCDAERGLLRVVDGEVVTLVDSFAGEPLLFTNNADVGSDGTVYFSTSSQRFGIAEYRSDILEHSGTGRLLAHRPSGATEVLVEGLFFANGVALAEDESFVLVAETGRYQITRLWLTGSRAGRTDLFVRNLPGIPDNLSRGPDGTFWVAMFTPRNRPLDLLLPHPRIRKVAAALPEAMQPQPVRYGFVVGFDAGGKLVRNLQDPAGGFAPITGVREHDGWLYLGSLTETAVGRIRLD